MEHRKRFKTIFIALVMIGALTGSRIWGVPGRQTFRCGGFSGPAISQTPHGPGQLSATWRKRFVPG